MLNTLFYDDHEKIVKNRAYSYHAVPDNKYKKSVLNFANVGATSLFTTVEDLALWAMNFSSFTVGDKAIIDKMNTLAVLNNGETFGGAYGQFINKYKGLNQIQHGGADAGYRSYLGRFPDQNFSVMVFSNLAQSNPGNLALQVADLYLEDAFEKESDAATNADDPIESQEFTPPNYEVSDLKEFVGAYFSPELNTTYEAVLKDGKLTVTHARASDFVISVAKNDLFLFDGKSFMFERNDKQQITGFRISSGRVKNLWFKKVK
ncbi:Beta-lactamase [Cyclobacterium qasimii M12-11B]|nr:serine hydrolase [Cyclobacterium qasimii]EPR69210.1 Beta-lactamase [Cyclobacterium qasimii M12-11B]